MSGIGSSNSNQWGGSEGTLQGLRSIASLEQYRKDDKIAEKVILWLDQEVRTQLKQMDLKLDRLSHQLREMPLSSRWKASTLAQQRSFPLAMTHPHSADRFVAEGAIDQDARPVARPGAAQQSPATSPREFSSTNLDKVEEASDEGVFPENGCCNSSGDTSSNHVFESETPHSLTQFPVPSKESYLGSSSVCFSVVDSLEAPKDVDSGPVYSDRSITHVSHVSDHSRASIGRILTAATTSIKSNLPQGTPRLSTTVKAVWVVMEDVESNQAAKFYSSSMCTFILLTVVFSLIQMAVEPPIKGLPAAVTETAFDIVFLVEFLLRLGAAPRKLRFVTNYNNVIDFVASVPPLVFRACIGFTLPSFQEETEIHRLWSARTVLLCLVPVLRLLKIIRHLRKFHLLVLSINLCMEALPTLLYALGVLTLAFAGIIYVVEPPDNIESLPRAIWLTMVTMTTVGYGDTTPRSTAGSIVVSLLVISSVLFMAMPLGIIGQAFNEIWKDRDRILVAKNTRERLVQWGYTASDLPHIFEHYSRDGSGDLTLDEFHDMVSKLDIGLSNERILELFQTFDEDDSGSVNAEEFIRILFPSEFLRMYRSN